MRILVTSADIDDQREMRSREYLQMLRWLETQAAAHDVDVLECVRDADAFLEPHARVHYARTHQTDWKNKGANLGLALHSYFSRHDVPEDELVLQLTGRYRFLDRSFLDAVEQHRGCDFYGREIFEYYGDDLSQTRLQYFTGCFAMRAGHFSDWVASEDWRALERDMINFERALWLYAEKNGLKRHHVEEVSMECNIFGLGETDLVIF